MQVGMIGLERMGSNMVRRLDPMFATLAPGSSAATPTPGRTLEAAIEEEVPAHVLAAALLERFSSRGEADFQDRVLSAILFEFGGHVEKAHRK